MHEYSAKELESLFHLSAAFIKSLIRAGYVRPVASGGRARYSFHDLLVLRTAGALRQARIPTRKIKAALQHLTETMPGSSASALSVSPAGEDIAIREGKSLFAYESGQYVLPLAAAPAAPSRLRARNAEPEHVDELAAAGHFDAAYLLEEEDGPAARCAYQACLRADAEHLDARINLGRLLHLAGELEEAERVYRAAKYPSATLLFNFAVLLEDMHRAGESVEHYRHALAMDPRFADAHFNLARLHELQSRPKEALRHLLAYKRLTAGSD